MATIKPVVLKENKRSDETWNIVFRLTHKRQSRYIKTSHYVGAENIDKSGAIKMDFIIDYLSSDIKTYRQKIDKLGDMASLMSVDEIKDALVTDVNNIDFLNFCDEYVKNGEILNELEPGTWGNYRNTIASLKAFSAGKMFVTDINSMLVKKFIAYLRSKEISDNTVRLYSLYFGKLFKELKNVYNNEDYGIIRIPQNPFANVTIPKKRNPPRRNLTINEIRLIRDYDKNPRYFYARAIFMFSLILCGINFKDIFDNAELFLKVNSRAEYERSKTRNKRQDRAFISITIPPEALEYLKYIVDYHKEYSHKNRLFFHQRANRYLKRIGIKTGINKDLTTYYARHTFATIARNDCRCRKEDVSMAMNHIDQSTKITDIYLEPDWSIIDDVQRAVINKINEDLKHK
ncbi:tyrosine-type recombinase/integrase [Sphingobacterium spiritivorum]|uniref:tyrosine-type recombinase/integrase n=1 Tax=Sphingobacterium spiritivorum TaxID=258 RepID=UPI003DA3F879